MRRLAATPGLLLVAVLGAAAATRIAWLNQPKGALIFDEAYYVNAARVLIGIPVPGGQHYAGAPAGIDPNGEHPPLGKLAIAGSIKLFGDNPVGWRFPSLVAGLASILLVYLAVRAADGDRWLALLAAVVLAFDNLAFVQGRIGTLDMLMVALLLFAAWTALRGWPLVAGAGCALAAMVKLPGSYGLAALALFYAGYGAFHWRDRRTFLRTEGLSLGFLVAGFVILFGGGLWLLDHLVTTYSTPWQHLQFMTSYGLNLSRPAGPIDYESYPWQWLFNEVQMPYLRVDQHVVSGTATGSRPLVFFRGAMNPIIIGTFPLALGYVLWRAARLGDRLSIWTLTWTAGNYLPYFPLTMVGHRISYIFYFLPALPAVAVAIGQLLRQAALPKAAVYTYLAAVLGGFAAYFPFRSIP